MKSLIRFICIYFFVAGAFANDIAVDPRLGEEIIFVKNDAVFPVSLEVTVFRPVGLQGKLPVVVINHGKQSGDVRFQPRYRPIPAVRSFLSRGYAVVVPMRQGFSKSGGRDISPGCNITSNGNSQAKDVRAVVNWLKKQDWADSRKIVMFGQSHGGLTTMAYSAEHTDIKFFVNFAGGLRFNDGACNWQLALRDAFKDYGKTAKAPSLWFYGANDSFFPPDVIQPAFAAYKQQGGVGDLIAFGNFGSDAHGMFGARAGTSIWLEPVLKKMAELNLPTDVVLPKYNYGSAQNSPSQVSSGFANIDELDKVPYLKSSGRKGYETFLQKSLPRAFAIDESGAWGWAEGETDSMNVEQRAVAFCARSGKNCKVYAIDNTVVWKP